MSDKRAMKHHILPHRRESYCIPRIWHLENIVPLELFGKVEERSGRMICCSNVFSITISYGVVNGLPNSNTRIESISMGTEQSSH